MTKEPEQRPALSHFDRLTPSRAALVVLFWALLAALMTPSAWMFAHRLTGTFSGTENSEPAQVEDALVDNFSTALAFPSALVWDAVGVPPEEADAAWSNLIDTAEAHPEIIDVSDAHNLMSGKVRDDWHVAFLELDVETFGQAELRLPQIREYLAEKVNMPGEGTFHITGGPAMFLDLNTTSTNALKRAELIALPVAFLILLVVFRTPLAALLPVLVAGVGVVITLGVLSFLAKYIPVTFFVPNLVTMIGLGVGIDYCLIYLARYRRERELHLTTQEALAESRRTAGHTVLVSAVLVMTGFLVLLVIPLSFFFSIALGGLLIVGCVAATTLTLLPALVVLLGSSLEWGQVYRTDGKFKEKLHNFYRWWSRWLLRNPWKCFLAGAALLLFIASPVTRLMITSLQVDTLPASAEARIGYESMEKELGPGWLLPTMILVQHPDESWWEPAQQERERALVERLEALPGTAEVVAPSDPKEEIGRRAAQVRSFLLEGDPDRTQTLILMIPDDDPQSTGAREWLRDVHRILDEEEAAHPDGPTFKLGGISAITAVTDEVIFSYLPIVIGLTLLTTFLLLLYFMKSIFVPLKAIVLNLLCVMAAYGFLVFWFQDGWGAGMGAFHEVDGLNTIVLVVMFCALFGLSMDYEVFILSAVRESWLERKDMDYAIEEGLVRTAGIITSAAIILVSVFLCFAFAGVLETQQLGTGMSFAVLLDATLIRCVLVPSSMALMGEFNWWLPGQPLPEKDEVRVHFQKRELRRLRRLRGKVEKMIKDVGSK
ncbi:MAG: MMPL family transporter [Verrucomicrobiota bacterium]